MHISESVIGQQFLPNVPLRLWYGYAAEAHVKLIGLGEVRNSDNIYRILILPNIARGRYETLRHVEVAIGVCIDVFLTHLGKPGWGSASLSRFRGLALHCLKV